MTELTKMQQAITNLNENDVLYGRGSGVGQSKGNRRFRDDCEARKKEYNAASKNKNKVKGAIAQEVFDKVHSRGGRFLELQECAGDDLIQDGIWYEVDKEKALDKIKQNLRQRIRWARTHTGPPTVTKSLQETSSSEAPENTTGPSIQIASNEHASNSAGMPVPYGGLAAAVVAPPRVLPSLYHQPADSLLPVLPIKIVANTAFSPYLSVLQSPSLNPYLCSMLTGQVLRDLLPTTDDAGHASKCRPDKRSRPDEPSIEEQQYLQWASPGITVETGTDVANGDAFADIAARKGGSSHKTTESESEEKTTPSVNDGGSGMGTVAKASAEDEDVAEFLLSVLQLSGLPRFTDHEKEKATMSDEETAAALSDMFGKYCNVGTPKSKKARRDLDPDSIAFLVKHMRNEIAKVPNDEKQALVEAQEKCEAEEFSDERLERFLRCVGMDAKRAAQRFVNYWESRKEVFQDKFTMRMTLSEALQDDLVALEAGWLCLLPTIDGSGRQLLYLEPARHKREGYSTDSMLRAAWYVIEVASRLNKEMNCGVVELVWDKHSSIWEYDHDLYSKHAYFESNCFPVKYECFHVCCTPPFIARVVAPICAAWQSKESRTRSVWHDVPEEELLSVLSEYGITSSILPEVFGGSIHLDQSEWIAQRRSIEMEEV